MLSRLRSFLDILARRARFERQMGEEMQLHLELRAADLERGGLPRAEARRRARLEFGGLDSAKDDCRQARGVRLLDEFVQDLRYAARLMTRTPGFTAAAILSLALGIGANTAIFSLIDAVMIRTLPLADVSALRFVAHGTSPATAGSSSNYPLFERYQALADVFSGVTAYSVTGFKVETPDGLESVDGLWVSGNFHGLLGVEIAHGRGFVAERDRAVGDAMWAVISDGYWSRRFGRDPDVIGRAITVDGRPIAIVGITAPSFTGLVPGLRPDLTLPLSIRAIDEPQYLDMHDTWTNLTIVARLRPDRTESAALAATDTAFQQYMSEPENQWIRKQSPSGAFANGQLVPAARGSGVLRRQYEIALKVLMAMVAIVLLIASVNVANLLLVRGAARAKEVAIRLCVGGGRPRLIRQFLTESALLALCGGALGLLFARWGTGAILGLLNVTESPVLLDVSPSPRVLAFTAGVSLLTGLAFGLWPAIRATRLDLTPALKDGAVGIIVGRRWSTSHALVASQVALCVLVLTVAALMVRTLYNLKTLEAGFERGNLLLFTLDTFGTPVPPAQRAELYRQVVEHLQPLPGVRYVSASTSSPVHTSGNSRALVVPPGVTVPDTPEGRGAWATLVTPEYFETLGIDFLRGRGFTAADANPRQKVAVVNATMARFIAGDRDPLGKTFSFRGDPDDLITIVGVVEDTHQMSLREAPPRTVYTPLAYASPAPSQLMIELRTAQQPLAVAGAARDAVRDVSKDVVIRYVRSIDEQIDASLVRERLLAMLSSSFALLALLLSAIGLYGVMSYNVTRRAREIGIRIALGAARSHVLATVLMQTLVVTVAGIIVGAVAAVLTTEALSSFLFDLSPRDPVTLAAVCIALLLTSLAASVLPAHRAATVDPVRAIRTE
jgi:predicted permease